MPIPKKPANLARLVDLNAKLSQKNNVASITDLSSRMKQWAVKIKPEPEITETLRIKAVPLTKAAMTAFAKVQQSQTPLVELAQNQKMTLDEYTGTFYSAIVVHQFGIMEKSFTSTKATARTTPAMLQTKKKNFERLTEKYLQALSRAGLKNLTLADLRLMQKELVRTESNFNQFINVFNSGKRTQTKAVATTLNIATSIPSILVDPLDRLNEYEIKVPVNWCGLDPIEGVFTKTWSRSFSYRQSFTYPCGVDCDFDWFNTSCDVVYCTSSFVLIAGSVSFSLEVGYKVDCCGAAAWGSLTSEVCGTLLGQRLCASCTGSVVAVAGVGRTTRADGQCVYGLGLNVSYSCKIQGYRVLSGFKPIGWNVVGSCPPLNICA
jgi:hypothetical protein